MPTPAAGAAPSRSAGEDGPVGSPADMKSHLTDPRRHSDPEGHFTRNPCSRGSPFGSWMRILSSVATSTSATTRLRYQLWSAGTTYHGAASLLVAAIASA